MLGPWRSCNELLFTEHYGWGFTALVTRRCAPLAWVSLSQGTGLGQSCKAIQDSAMPCYAMHGWEITMSSNLLQRAPLVWVQLLQYNTCAKMRNSRLINCGPPLNVRHLLDFDAEMRCPELHSTDFSIARRHLVQHQHISSIWISFGPGALCIRMSIGLPRYWLSRAKDSPSST